MSKILVRNLVDTTTDFHIDKTKTLVAYNGTDTDVVVPDGILAIGSCAFKETNVEKVIIPPSVQRIDEAAFIYCRKLKVVHFSGDNKVLYIGAMAFRQCESLNAINLPNGLHTIYSDTFKNCTSLREIVIPSSVTLIKDNAFEGCSSLDKVSVGDYTSIETFAFPSYMVEKAE